MCDNRFAIETTRHVGRECVPAHAPVAKTDAPKSWASGGTYTPMEEAAVKALAGNRCLRCGRTHTVTVTGRRIGITIDHVVAIANGGTNDGTNDVWSLQPLCYRCNSSKGNHHHTDYRPAGWAERLKRLLAGERVEPFKTKRRKL